MRNYETGDVQDSSIKSRSSTPLLSCSPSTYHPAASTTSNTEYSPQLQEPFTGGDEDFVSKTLDSTTFTTLEPSLFHSNPTPPIDDAPIDSYYRGYGHIPYTDFHPQPTPPSDLTPSLINASYAQYNPTSTTSLEIEHQLSFSAQPPVYSFYQGYGYGEVPTKFPPPPGSPPSKCDTTESEHDSNLQVGDEYQACPSFRYQIENSRACALSENVSNSESRDAFIPVGISTQQLSNHAGINNEYSKDEISNFRHSAASQGSWDSEQELPTFQAELQSAELSSSGALQYEAWRHTVLASLNETPKNPSLNTCHLADYLSQRFNRAEHADCHVRIFYKSSGHGVADFLLHGLLIAQSPFLQSLMSAAVKQENGMMLLEIQTRDRFLSSSALESALHVCYGKSIIEFDGCSSDSCASKSGVELSRDWMENALAFAASGYLLQLEDVISRGLQIASSILNWENIEKLLSFALDGGLDPVWDPNQMLHFTTEQSASQSENTTEIATPSTSQNSAAAEFSVSSEPSGQPSPEFSRGTYSPRANDLLLQCLEFMISEFPPLWELDVSARPLAEIDRLPLTAGSRSPLAKSRLSLIRFGDHPSEWAVKLSDKRVTLSSILLSLHFVLLKHILDRQDEPTRARIVQPIIDERERRRRQALKCKIVTCQGAADDWTQVGWEEFVELEQGSRMTLQRKWTGFDKLSA